MFALLVKNCLDIKANLLIKSLPMAEGLELDDLLKSLPTQPILQFYGEYSNGS